MVVTPTVMKKLDVFMFKSEFKKPINCDHSFIHSLIFRTDSISLRVAVELIAGARDVRRGYILATTEHRRHTFTNSFTCSSEV